MSLTQEALSAGHHKHC